MEVAKINATVRQETGKRAVARLRTEGRVPGVMYGQGSQNARFTLDVLELQAHLRQHHRVFKVKLDGAEQAAYLQDVQYDCLTDEPLHVDFKRIDLNKPIDLVVEIVLLGHPVGLGKGGVLIRDRMEIEVSALPNAIPENLPIKIDHLDIGGRVLAKDLQLPAGVTLRLAPESTICHVTEARVEAASATPGEAAEPAKAADEKKDDKS
ncbi:MAG: 50S ribosomal protein L25 [Planctomycetota bacterium]